MRKKGLRWPAVLTPKKKKAQTKGPINPGPYAWANYYFYLLRDRQPITCY